MWNAIGLIVILALINATLLPLIVFWLSYLGLFEPLDMNIGKRRLVISKGVFSSRFISQIDGAATTDNAEGVAAIVRHKGNG